MAWTRKGLIAFLKSRFDKLHAKLPEHGKSYDEQDLKIYFRCQALWGCVDALKSGASFHRAKQFARVIGSNAVHLWYMHADRSNYQRCERDAWDYLDSAIQSYKEA